ncbi:MAG: hypothetical protein MUF62_14375, partial [Chitinophagaceae bacterium]|nr:hypothetical protein [Chitinophagaceae bacterium]
LGDFGGLVNTNAGKDNLHLVNDNGQWFLFVVGINTNGINVAYPFVRISLGASISNTSPAAEDLTSVGGFAGPEDVAFVKEGNRWLALVVNSSIAGQLTRLDFGSSLANLPVSTLLGNLGGALVNPARIQVFNRAGSWFALVYDVPTDRVVPLLFGTSLLNTPIASQLNTPAGTSNAVYVRGCSNELLAISYTSISAPQFRSSFYSEALGFIRTQAFNLPSILPDLRHWKPIADSLGGYVFFSRNSLFITPPQSGDTLFRLVFGGCPGSSIPSATTMVPPPVRFSAPGTYTVQLTIDAGMATEQSVCRTIVVLPGGCQYCGAAARPLLGGGRHRLWRMARQF